jgi:hypothetical protein
MNPALHFDVPIGFPFLPDTTVSQVPSTLGRVQSRQRVAAESSTPLRG